MTQNAWPFTGQTITMAQFRAWSRVAQGSRVWSGLSVTADTSGRNLIVTAGTATVDGCMFTSDATTTLAVPANTTGTMRRAYAMLTLDDSATPQIQLGVKLGPAGGGAASFTQTESGVYELPLAYATLASGAASFAGSGTTRVCADWQGPTVDISSQFTQTSPGHWQLSYLSAQQTGKVVTLTFRVTRLSTDFDSSKSWYQETLFRIPSSLSPAGEMHIAAVSNAHDTWQNAIYVQVVGTSVNLRKPVASVVLPKGGWLEFSGSWVVG